MALIGVENGYPIGEDIGRIKEFYERGGRYMSLAHNGHSQLSDSNTGRARRQVAVQRPLAAGQAGHRRDEPLGHHGGRLAPLEGVDDAGPRAVEGADHRVALVGARALPIVSRNLDDEQLLALKKNGGVAADGGVRGLREDRRRPTAPERAAAIAALRQELAVASGRCRRRSPVPAGGRGVAGMTDDAAHDSTRQRAWPRSSTQFPGDRPRTVKDFVDHIDYVVKKIGIDHVGISSDFDGGGGDRRAGTTRARRST